MNGAAHTCDGTRPGCLGCAAIARRQAEVRAVMTRDDRLDDVTRARIWSRLDAELDVDGAAPRARGRARWAIAAGAIAVAAGVAWIALARGGAPPDGVPPDDAPLVAPADTTLTTRLGPHTRAALVGPAQLAVIGRAGDATTVRLDRGTLYASFEGGGGRSLRVLAPGAVVEVVGTLFAVDAHGGRTCVSVEHGRVRVTMGARVAYVGGGERLCSDDAAVGAIEPRVKEELVRHETATASAASSAPLIVGAPAVADVAIAPPPPPAPIAPSNAPIAPPAPPIAVTPIGPLAVTRPARSQAVVVTEAAPAPAGPQPPQEPPPQAQSPAEQQPPPHSPPPPSDDDLYRAAETALASHDPAAADRALAALLARSPASPLADQALYERARIAYARHAWSEARADLVALAAFPSSPLVEPGRYLACRIEVEAHDADAPRCLAAYRADFPGSPHDLDVLGLLAQLADAGGGCAAARPYVDALAADHADAAITRAWRARCPVRR